MGKPVVFPKPGEFVSFYDKDLHPDAILGKLVQWCDVGSGLDYAVVLLQGDETLRRVTSSCLGVVNQPRFKRGDSVQARVHERGDVITLSGVVCHLEKHHFFSQGCTPSAGYKYLVWIDCKKEACHVPERDIEAAHD
jgi:hypothetical protein